MAKRKRAQQNEQVMQVLFLSMLLFLYLVQPTLQTSSPTFGHAYFGSLFSEFYESMSYPVAYAYEWETDLYSTSNYQITIR